MQRIVLFSEVNILIICWLISVCVCTVEGSQGILMMGFANYCFVETDQIPHYLHMSNCMLIFEFDVFAVEHCQSLKHAAVGVGFSPHSYHLRENAKCVLYRCRQ
ncbi:uncharacterized protein PHALS_15059 [Plasmopara halstedii]|uniref:RxLR-like protein n=1 Tax=Plasmopara halstedii TaxID=4781 RepID=A0A0P1B0Q9_PLAHL|nr:uncharacterized protein PHALS_15059 [Plasmopara halstedii]CEG47749.1 hypothetical protein PHALS_15059 [Plasmopara halstedii]|eukprot:XP_024584118.1 hypothetical protein PHALS_15059 [Plasmopara halstedii]